MSYLAPVQIDRPAARRAADMAPLTGSGASEWPATLPGPMPDELLAGTARIDTGDKSSISGVPGRNRI